MFLVVLLFVLVSAGIALARLAPARAAAIGVALARHRAGLSRDSVAIPGAVMPYLEGGHGETIVLLHSFGCDKDSFLRTAAYLTRHYHVVIPDLPAFGEASRHVDTEYTIERQAEHLHAFLYKLGLDRVHLGGVAMGGFIAAEFAARHPLIVRSLWLLSACGTAAGRNVELERAYAATGAAPWLMTSTAGFDQLLAAATERPPYLPACLRHTLGRRGMADHALHTQVLRALKNSPFLEAQFYRIEAPALIVWGSDDRFHAPAGADALQAIMPNSRVIRLDGVGALPMLETPRRCSADYLAFLEALPRRAA